MTDFVIAGGNDNYFASVDLAAYAEELPHTVLSQYGVVLLMQETSAIELDELGSELPTDTHLVTYTAEGDPEVRCDAVRAYKKSDIFDCYHDARRLIRDIKSGFGKIKPKLFVDQRKDADKE